MGFAEAYRFDNLPWIDVQTMSPKDEIRMGGIAVRYLVEGASVKRGYHLRIEESVAQSDSCRQHRPALALAYYSV
jgi:hypothetical protein